MHLIRVFAALLVLATGSRVSLADSVAECISACEKPAVACADTNRIAKTKCVRSVRDSCRDQPIAKLTVCVTAASKACVTTHNPAIAACDTTFKACHTACFGGKPVTRGYWCMHQADSTDDITRKTGYCELEQSKASLDACLKRFDLPATGGSIVTTECQPL